MLTHEAQVGFDEAVLRLALRPVRVLHALEIAAVARGVGDGRRGRARRLFHVHLRFDAVARDAHGVTHPDSVGVRQAHRARKRLGQLRPLTLLIGVKLRTLTAIDLRQPAELHDLRDIGTLFRRIHRRHVTLELFEDVLGHRHVREQTGPEGDLGMLDRLRGLQLLVRTHHLVGRHVAEIPREHRVRCAVDIRRRRLRSERGELGFERLVRWCSIRRAGARASAHRRFHHFVGGLFGFDDWLGGLAPGSRSHRRCTRTTRLRR